MTDATQTHPNQTTKAAPANSPLSLSLPPVEEIAAQVREELTSRVPEDPELATMADAFVREVLTAGDMEGAASRQRQAAPCCRRPCASWPTRATKADRWRKP